MNYSLVQHSISTLDETLQTVPTAVTPNRSDPILQSIMPSPQSPQGVNPFDESSEDEEDLEKLFSK